MTRWKLAAAVAVLVLGFGVGIGAASAQSSTSGIESNRRHICLADATAGGLDWAPAGPLERDVYVDVLHFAPGTPCQSDGTVEGLTYSYDSYTSYEPAYYQATGDGATYPSAPNGWPVTWAAGDTVQIDVYDYGPCSDSACGAPDGFVYGLASGWAGLPSWVTGDGAGGTTTTTSPSAAAAAAVHGAASQFVDTTTSAARVALPFGILISGFAAAWAMAKRFLL